MPSMEYWRQRSEARMDTYLRNSNDTMQLISQAHARAQADIQAEIDAIYARYEKAYKLDLQKARELLQQPVDQAEYERLRTVIAGIKNPARRRPLASQASSGAYAFRIKRLEALKLNVTARLEKLADVQLSTINKGLTDTIKQAYQLSIFDVQRSTGHGFSFDQLGDQAIEEILHNPWSGRSFSQRVWGNTSNLAEMISQDITAGFASGRSIKRMAADLSARMQVSYRAAERLVRTEVNYMANAAEMQSYKECGIEKYEYMASLDMHTSEICRDLDGHIFLVKDARAGYNMPPMHPNCRSTTVAALTTENDDALQRRARDPITGRNVLVPQDMKYEDWLKKFGNTAGNLSANIGQYLKSGANLHGIPSDVVSGIERSYRMVMHRWPQLQGEFQALGTNERRPSVYASCYLSTGEINVNPHYYQDKIALKRSYDKDVAANWHPAGTDWEDIVTHELGHAIDGYLTRNMAKVSGMATAKGRASTYIMNDVLKALKKTPADISAGLSDYAAMKPEEFFAEAMAEYLGSWLPRPMAKRTGKLVNKWMKDISRHP